MSEYARPEVLVETNEVADNLDAANTRIVEVDYDPTTAYNQEHVPGAVLFDWKTDLNDPVARDIVTSEQFNALLSKAGISKGTNVILYGDFTNWFAAFAFWIFKYYGHDSLQLMNGGRKKWIEEDRPSSTDTPSYQSTNYIAEQPDESIRAYQDHVQSKLGSPNFGLVDVRSPKEFDGEVLAPPEYPTEHAQRGGHIPGAANIPWSQAIEEDGTFKPTDELKRLYEPRGITSEKEIIAYCRIGERSSHSWFVLKYLLGYSDVRNYDGSWTEWGNMMRNPIEK